MAVIELTYDEAQGGRLPMVCAKCGMAAYQFCTRKVSFKSQLVLAVRTTSVNVQLPFCPHHMEEEFHFFYHATAENITDHTVTLKEISPAFVDAVWHYRDQAHWAYYSSLQARARAEGHDIAIPPYPSAVRARAHANGEGGNTGLILGIVFGSVILLLVVFGLIAIMCTGSVPLGPPRPQPFPPRINVPPAPAPFVPPRPIQPPRVGPRR